MSDSSRHCLRARWLLPVDSPPIEDGVITIEAGRIVGLASGHDPEATDLGNVAIVPGLVNAHTHLEFSDLSSPLAPAQPFPEWVRALLRHRQTRCVDRRDAIDAGLRECARSGCTLIGEIATDDTTVARLSRKTPQGIVFREVLGIAEEVREERLVIARDFLEQASSLIHGDVIGGLSPHAPYSLSEGLFRGLIDLAVQNGAPVAMHVAETREELELLQSGTGPMVDMLRDFGVWRDTFWIHGGTVRGYLEELSRACRALVVHGNYLTEEELEFLATQPQMTVVYCPRTHHFFGHQDHPWQQLIEFGANLALGTDSRASNPDLSLWGELQFLARQHPEVQQLTLLKLATINGARAFGLADVVGTLTPGKQADLAVIRLTDEFSSPVDHVTSLKLMAAEHVVVATMRAGRWLHQGAFVGNESDIR